jgi:SAM-dependent methyltransferase
MRKNIYKFVELCSRTLVISEPIYEFGALQIAGQEDLADLRPLFPGMEYIGTDMREGKGVDKIIDLHDMKLPPESIGTALILDTVEHVEYPRKAIGNIYNALKPQGIIIISSHMNFPIHDYPNDYWRFTPEGFKSLLKIFTYSFVDSGGKPDFPHSVFGFACKGNIDKDNINKNSINKDSINKDSINKFTEAYEKLKWWWYNVEKELKRLKELEKK